MVRGGAGFGLLALLATLQLGCNEPNAPADPSFATDVRPIFQARCVRCHGAGGTLNSDPLIPGFGAPTQSFLGEYDNVQTGCPGPMDPPQAPSATCHLGAASSAALIKIYIHKQDDSRMPPPPSPALDDWQMAIVDAWVAKSPPNR